MISDKQNAYQTIALLTERFEEQLPFYKKADYNETLVRRHFIDPFFKALGWDIDNSQGYAEAYREVIHEDRVKVTIFSLNLIPIKNINDDTKKQLINLVNTILQLNQQLQPTTLPQQQEQLKQRIAFTDKKIDALVYELYGLTEDEIKIVEGNG